MRICVAETHLEISSPDGFPDGISPNNLLDAQTQGARNPLLADAFKRIGLADRIGRGVERIFEASLLAARNPKYAGSICLHLRA